MRLGRVFQLKGREDKAIRELKWSLEHAEDPTVELIANIILGAIYSDRGELAEVITGRRKGEVRARAGYSVSSSDPAPHDASR